MEAMGEARGDPPALTLAPPAAAMAAALFSALRGDGAEAWCCDECSRMAGAWRCEDRNVAANRSRSPSVGEADGAVGSGA